ncbi:MAG: hypothetical protein ACREI3_02360 [Nitrospirales bacterium]
MIREIGEGGDGKTERFEDSAHHRTFRNLQPLPQPGLTEPGPPPATEDVVWQVEAQDPHTGIQAGDPEDHVEQLTTLAGQKFHGIADGRFIEIVGSPLKGLNSPDDMVAQGAARHQRLRELDGLIEADLLGFGMRL